MLRNDTLGGFFAGNDAADEQQQRKRPKIESRVTYLHDVPADAACRDCASPEIDADFWTHYRLCVCQSCREELPEKYTLLTKTEAQQDYLLTDEELRDTTRMPFWERPNPRKSSYARMKLYVRCQVEKFAFEVKQD